MPVEQLAVMPVERAAATQPRLPAADTAAVALAAAPVAASAVAAAMVVVVAVADAGNSLSFKLSPERLACFGRRAFLFGRDLCSPTQLHPPLRREQRPSGRWKMALNRKGFTGCGKTLFHKDP
jgi:hypothetical protein